MRHLRPLVLLLTLLLIASCTGDPPEPIRVGAIYPLTGTQGMGGIDEYHGVRVAADLVNADGGIDGRPIALDQVDVPEADAAPGAIKALAGRGVNIRAITTSEIKFSVLIDEAYTELAVRTLHSLYGLDKT